MIAGLRVNTLGAVWVSTHRLLVVSPAADGEPQEIARGADLRGLSWLPSGSGLVYSSPAGSTVLYPPIFNLRAVERDGTGDRQLTFGDVSHVSPTCTRPAC